METKKMGEIYQKIADKIDDMIPVEWDKVYLYAEVLENDSTEVYFYFSELGKDTYTYWYYIPQIYNINKDLFKQLRRELFKYFEELHKEYINNNPEVWTNLTLFLDSNGKFKIDFDYEDVLASGLFGTQRQAIWKYKYLGIYPSDEDAKKVVDEYIKSQENN